jgi:UDP-N-acetylmuramoyl-tripeptide--D-alanyl-D-alanine ligase
MAPRDTRLVCLEIGTNHPGEIAALCRVARPTGGIITNIGSAHLEGLGSIEGVAREKGDLAASLPADGFVVLNADCRFTPLVRQRTCARVITFGIGTPGENDLDATDLLFHSGGTTFKLGGREITTPLLGTHNVQNLLAALGVALGLGIDLERVLPQVAGLQGGPQRMERVELADCTVFDDTYNSNPQALRAAVRVLSGLHGYGRRVLVLGDMLELGSLAAELHHQVGVEAARSGVDLLVLVGELARAAGAGALEAGLPRECVVHFDGTEAAAAEIGRLLQPEDAVLVKGSRLLRMERIVEVLRSARG